MVGRAAQRNRQIERREARVDQIEQRRIFDREHPADPRVVAVLDRQPRLKAFEAGVTSETGGGEAQLIGIGRIFRVVDDEVLAADRRQRDVQGARLGRGLAGRGDDHIVARRQIQRSDSRERFRVALFDDQLDVELGVGIVRYYVAPVQSENQRIPLYSGHGRDSHSHHAPL